MRVGNCLNCDERDNHRGLFDVNGARMIVLPLLMYILGIINERRTPVRMLELYFYYDDNDTVCGKTEFKRLDLRTGKVYFNLCKIRGLFQLVGCLLHELSHVLVVPNYSHDVQGFYKHFICLYGAFYYKIPIFFHKLGIDFDYDKLNKI